MCNMSPMLLRLRESARKTKTPAFVSICLSIFCLLIIPLRTIHFVDAQLFRAKRLHFVIIIQLVAQLGRHTFH